MNIVQTHVPTLLLHCLKCGKITGHSPEVRHNHSSWHYWCLECGIQAFIQDSKFFNKYSWDSFKKEYPTHWNVTEIHS